MRPIPKQKPHSLAKAKLLRPISKRYRARCAIAEEPVDIRRVFDNAMMTNDKKLLFVRNHKAGCTSVSQLIVHSSTGKYSRAVSKHNIGIFRGAVDYFDIRAGFESEGTYCFSVSRNPLDRLISSFFNVFIDRKNRSVRSNFLPIQDRGFTLGGDISQNFDVFINYVHEAISEAPYDCDPHWREQHVNIGNGRLPFNYIAKLENYNEDIRYVFEEAGLGDYLSTVEWTKKYNVSSREHINISKAQIARIESIYAQDYEIFGY
jgi:hypothetical protein